MCPKTEALLFTAARAQSLHEIVFPALKEGKIVLSDRYVDSSYVYQGFSRKLGIRNIKKLNDWATDGLMPDITICLLVDYEEMMRRKNKIIGGRLDRIERESKKFFEDVYKYHLRLADKFKERFYVIDATQSIEKIHEDIKKIVISKLN